MTKKILHLLLSIGFVMLTVFSLLTVEGQSADMSDFTAYDVAKLKTVGSVQIAPDGQRVAYTLSVQRNPFDEENGSAWSELHVVDKDGETKPFVSGKVNVADVSWVPDGSAITFVDKRDDDEERSLYSIPVDGGEASKILEHENGISSYSWSPDGKTVAFLSKSEKTKEEKDVADKGFSQEIYEEDWKPVEVWIYNTQTKEKPRKIALDGSASELHWSPDGKYLALALAPTSLIDDYYMKRRIRIVDAEDRTVIQKIENPGKLGDVRWSPDSKSLAFASGIDIHDPSDGRLMVADVKSGEFKNLLPGFKGHVDAVEWVDKNTIAYIASESVWTTFKTISKDGNSQKTLIEKDGPILDGFTLSSDGKSAAFDVESPKHPDEVYYYEFGKKLTRLTNHNPWLKDKKFGEQAVVTWTARDGLELQGVLIKPVDYKKGKRYPLILSVHGGPESHDSNGWLTSYSDPGQVGANQGFAVFYPNYRGSTGRGVKFLKSSQNDPAGKEFDDLVDAVDHFVATGLADEAKVGITGGSYGGYASAWGATYYSNRFAASVMFVGISDKISKTGTSDIPQELYLVHDSTWPWEDWNHYLESSPIFYVEKAHTPLLIMHGEDDTRVNPGQSMELYRFLKVRGETPVRLVFYKDEGHGNRKAAARLDYSLRLMRWMNHYLKEDGGDPPAYPIEYQEDLLD
mgnify:CR=1 FL=1